MADSYSHSQIHVLHTPSVVGGNAWYLSRAERELGVKSDVVTFRSSAYGFLADKNLGFENRGKISRGICRWRFYREAVQHYEVFHFNFGSSILHIPKLRIFHADLKWLKRAGKVVIVTYQGCDIRSFRYAVSNYSISACRECRRCDGRIDELKARSAEVVERYADHVYILNPDLAAVAPKGASFRPYTKLDLVQYPSFSFKEYQSGDPIRIVHAPTDRMIKGTKYVEKAVRELQNSGYNVELHLIEGLTREQALKKYETADIVVDQLLIGWYGGVAVEAMALGKPVIAYLRREDFGGLPLGMAEDIPIQSATPATLADQLSELIDSQEKRYELGLQGWEFVQKWHNPKKIAFQTVSLYSSLLGKALPERVDQGVHEGSEVESP